MLKDQDASLPVRSGAFIADLQLDLSTRPFKGDGCSQGTVDSIYALCWMPLESI